jgi:hypothetical protein
MGNLLHGFGATVSACSGERLLANEFASVTQETSLLDVYVLILDAGFGSVRSVERYAGKVRFQNIDATACGGWPPRKPLIYHAPLNDR